MKRRNVMTRRRVENREGSLGYLEFDSYFLPKITKHSNRGRGAKWSWSRADGRLLRNSNTIATEDAPRRAADAREIYRDSKFTLWRGVVVWRRNSSSDVVPVI
ncbi:hypothetical protein TNCV_419411 [Trichonephila clavipes]|uniref:Uncharacterized protein n=1 Tax=Trichonephila clavipes TaxID=2585209 RepID=A0A8X6VG14_TRICX|nr:hypothetical protein TNCV_419411 [Trichonephila clavipes]